MPNCVKIIAVLKVIRPALRCFTNADETACSLFGMIKLKNRYGKQVRGIERSTFVLDKIGIFRREWRSPKADGHAQEVLDFIETLN